MSQNEVPLRENGVKEFAMELIKAKCPKFKGSYIGLKSFLVRNNLSLRALDKKAAQRYFPDGEISQLISRRGQFHY